MKLYGIVSVMDTKYYYFRIMNQSSVVIIAMKIHFSMTNNPIIESSLVYWLKPGLLS